MIDVLEKGGNVAIGGGGRHALGRAILGKDSQPPNLVGGGGAGRGPEIIARISGLPGDAILTASLGV